MSGPNLADDTPEGFWLGELVGSGNGLCHVFPNIPGDEPQRLPHIAVCWASTGRGAVLVQTPFRRVCPKCMAWVKERNELEM